MFYLKKYYALFFLVSLFYITTIHHHPVIELPAVVETIQFDQSQNDLDSLTTDGDKDLLLSGILTTLFASLLISLAVTNYYCNSFQRIISLLLPVKYQSNYVVSLAFE